MQLREKMIERNLGSTQTTHLGCHSQIYLCMDRKSYRQWKKTNIKKKIAMGNGSYKNQRFFLQYEQNTNHVNIELI